MYVPPRNDPEYSRLRLNRIMSRRRLSFNPYTVSDQRLMEIVATTGWGNELDIVQLTEVCFPRLHIVDDYRNFDGIYMCTPATGDEVFLSSSTLTIPITANDTLRPVRSAIGRTPIRKCEDIESLVGKRYFVSHLIRGMNRFGSYRSAYSFHRITGNTEKDAAMIRSVMCQAKIIMLQRILNYPYSQDYLSCRKGLIEYESRILRAIELIRRFPETPIPR